MLVLAVDPSSRVTSASRTIFCHVFFRSKKKNPQPETYSTTGERIESVHAVPNDEAASAKDLVQLLKMNVTEASDINEHHIMDFT